MLKGIFLFVCLLNVGPGSSGSLQFAVQSGSQQAEGFTYMTRVVAILPSGAIPGGTVTK